jgi:hypothetical protein
MIVASMIDSVIMPRCGTGTESDGPVFTWLDALIAEAVQVRLPYRQDSRDGRLMPLSTDEVLQLPRSPLNPPFPTLVCESFTSEHGRNTDRTFRPNPRIIYRLFVRHSSLTFGPWRAASPPLAAPEMLARD